MTEKPAIGFIGLGLMGSAMVERLQSLDYALSVVANRSRPNVDAAVAQGAREVETAREVAATSDIVMLCVDTSASVEARMFGPDGVIAGLKPGTTVIDFGTSLPESTKTIGERVAAAGGRYMDAPLGRTPAHAVDGKLNIMAAGDVEDFSNVETVLRDLGENVFHVGPLGAGHTLKLINNYFGMTVACAMAEAFAMADRTGVPRDQLYSVMSAGPLHSGMMDFVKAYAVDQKPDALAFTIANARKDVGYYNTMADALGAETLMGTGAKRALGLAKSDGHGERYVAEMVDFFSDTFTDR